MKNWIIRIVGLILAVVIALIVYIEVNKDKLAKRGIQEVSNQIDGTIKYTDVKVSLLKSFPHLGITFVNLEVISSKNISPISLFKAGEISMSINLLSIFRSEGPIQLRFFEIEEALLHLEQHADGSTNFDIYHSEKSSTGAAYDLDIQGFKITNSKFSYVNYADNDQYNLSDIGLHSRVKYKNGQILINSDAKAKLKVLQGKTIPVIGIDVSLKSDLQMDPIGQTYTLRKGEVQLNDLPINVIGNVDLGSDQTYNLTFSSPSNDIKQLISVIPAYYNNEYASIISQGTYSIEGSISGNGIDQYPLYDVKIEADNGALSYPSLNSKVENFSFDLAAKNVNKSTLYSHINIRNVDLKIGESTLTGKFSTMPMASSHKTEIDMMLDFNLKDIKESVLLSKTSKLSGKLLGHINSSSTISNHGKKVTLENELFDTKMDITDVVYLKQNTSIRIKDINIEGDTEKINYSFQGLAYNDALLLDLKGFLNEPLKIIHDSSHTFIGNVAIDAEEINMDKLVNSDSISQIKYDIPDAEFSFVFNANNLIRGKYEFIDITANGSLNNRSSELSYEVGSFKNSSIKGDAVLQNILGFGLNNDTLGGHVKIVSDKLNLDPFILSEGDNKGPLDQELLPGNIDLDIDFSAEEVSFKNIAISKSLGKIGLRDREILFKNEGDIFGGKVVFSGSFDSKIEDGYGLNLSLTLDGLKFEETAKTIKLFSDLIPISKLLEGSYTTTLNWDSKLNKLFIPDLNSLSAYGEIETQDGSIKGFLPIDSFIQSIVKVEEKDLFEISDTKKYFLIKDGKVIVKQVDLTRDDISLSFSGSHGFNQVMDYEVLIDVPKNKLKSDELLSFVQDKIKFNDRIKAASDDVIVQVAVQMAGAINRPKISLKSINLKKGNVVESITEQAIETIQDARDSVRTLITDTIESTTTMVKDKIDSTKDEILFKIDSTKEEISDKIDSTIVSLEDIIQAEKEDLKNEGKTILDSIKAGNVDSILVKFEDLFGKKQSKIDSLKKSIPLDIFKKKKEGGKGSDDR